jgi:hypothetical protein
VLNSIRALKQHYLPPAIIQPELYLIYDQMTVCCIHTNFFDDTCTECRKEYAELKGLHEIKDDDDDDSNTTRNYKPANTTNGASGNTKKMQQQQQEQEQQQELSKYYKEFTEERAKRLYQDLLLQFLRSNKYNEFEASHKARSIIRKQCLLRNMPLWPWL